MSKPVFLCFANLMLGWACTAVAANDTTASFVEYIPVPIERQARAADIVVRVSVSQIKPIQRAIGAGPCGWEVTAKVAEAYKGDTPTELTFFTDRYYIVDYKSVGLGDQLLLFLDQQPARWRVTLDTFFGNSKKAGSGCDNQNSDFILRNEYENAFPIVVADKIGKEAILYWAARTEVSKAETPGIDRSPGCGKLTCPIEPWSAPLSLIVPMLK